MNCKNCQSSLSETSDYCYSCGGKVIRNRLTMGNLFAHFSETYFNYDNKFLQTFVDLCRKPDVVINTYIDGTRKKYVDVISYFALAITLSGLQLYILNKFFPDAMDMSAWTVKGGEELQKKNMSFVQEYQSIIMMLYVPMYALISKIVFYNKKKFNYTEQLVIYMYIQAQISIASALITIILVISGVEFGLLAMFMIPAMIAYSAYCLKNLYDLSVAELILKSLIFFIILGIVGIIIILAATVIMYLSGDLEGMIEAQKAAQSVK